ncbi:MAG: PaaI family thioesterase, partial [Candidatus Binatia bacterium]
MPRSARGGTAEVEYIRFPPSGCFGCSQSNPSSLGLRFYRDGERVACDHLVETRFDGAPGIVHGGVQAAILDEVMCAVVTFLHGRRVVTGELTLRYRRPCPSRAPIRAVAWIEEARSRYARVRGEIRDGA